MSSVVRGLVWVMVGSLFVARTAASSPLEAVPGEYIVELREPSGNLSAARIPGVTANPSTTAPGRALGARMRLVSVSGPPSIGGVSAARSQADADFCASLPKASVKSCSPNYIVRSSKTSNDPLLVELWGLGAVSGADARSAWDSTTGSAASVIAVVDSGVDYTHPDLAQNMWRNLEETPGNGIDDDGNGYIDDVFGIDAISGSGDPQDENGHGTHVSGTIGARGDNGIGVVGVNWNTSIMALRFLDAEGSGTIADAIEAMNYIIAQRERGVPIRVINASWGGGGYSEPFVSTLHRLNELGVIFVAAAGNESTDNDAAPSYPSSYQVPNVVAVGAISEDQNLADFSNFGATSVDLVAPGVGIVSTVPGGGYARMSGTSMASPHVAGALALLTSHEPNIGVEAAVARLLETGVALPSVQGLVASGRALNIGRLVRGESTPIVTPPVEDLVCAYDVAQSSYGRDTAADSAPVIQRGDELGFVQVQLPFEFPFHRDRYTTVTVSPNGVLYMGQGPGESSFDFDSGPTAPRRSIAAFHTDLVAAGSGSGVRVAVAADRATFRWVASLYGWLDGSAEVTLTIFADGTIRDSIEFSSDFVELVAQFGATIGLAGSIPESTVTYTTGGPSIRSGLELTFTPFCSGVTPAQATRLRLASAKRSGAKSLRVGERFLLDVRTDRPGGSVDLGVLVNGRVCSSGTKKVRVPTGVTHLEGSTRVLEGKRGVNSLGFFSKSVVAQKRISQPAATRGRSLRKASTGPVCRSVLRSLRVTGN